MPEIIVIEPVSLTPKDPQDISPLSIGNLTASPVPFELAKHRVLGRLDHDVTVDRELDFFRAMPLELHLVKRLFAKDEDVDLESRAKVNEVETSLVSNRAMDHLGVDVKSIFKTGHQFRYDGR